MTGELKFVDKTRELSTAEDIQESIKVVEGELLKGLLQLPPGLGLQMAAIHRHLKELLAIRQFLDKKRAEQGKSQG